MRGLTALGLIVAFEGCSFPVELSADGGPVDAPPTPLVDASPDATPVDTAPAVCPASYSTEFEGHRYRLSSQAVTWQDAKLECESDGGHLMKIESAGENDAAAFLLFGFFHVWIGLHDDPANTGYVWHDGSVPTYTKWGTQGSDDCVGLYSEGGRWDTLACTEARRAICECEL